jgi:6-pyruvoyltetrahydropterin/6-carboxytetrahydropterin synthase
MRFTRVYRFSASHRLHSDRLSNDENARLYGKCNNPYGHGHDYMLEVTARGEVDVKTGRLINPSALDRFIEQRVLRVFDHKDMNKDVPGFEGVPTTENLTIEIERRVSEDWAEHFGAAEIDRIWVRETQRNTFELRIR